MAAMFTEDGLYDAPLAPDGHPLVPAPSRSPGREWTSLGREVHLPRMVHDDRVGGLFGYQLVLLGQAHPEAFRTQQLHHRGPVRPVRAGRVAERVPAAPVVG